MHCVTSKTASHYEMMGCCSAFQIFFTLLAQAGGPRTCLISYKAVRKTPCTQNHSGLCPTEIQPLSTVLWSSPPSSTSKPRCGGHYTHTESNDC